MGPDIGKYSLEEFMKNKLQIVRIPTYPDDGSAMMLIGHELPFIISRGQDGFPYLDRNKLRHEYNMGDQVSDSWIIEISNEMNVAMFRGIFNIRESKDWRDLYKYGNKMYLKALRNQINLAKKSYADRIKWIDGTEKIFEKKRGLL